MLSDLLTYNRATEFYYFYISLTHNCEDEI